MLPRRLPKKAKRAFRWRSAAHCNFVRDHECSLAGCDQRPIEVSHVRIGSNTGIGQKPDDWRTVSLCAAHHQRQHNIGEASFWRGIDVEALIAAFIKASPRRLEIDTAMRERGL